MLLIIDTSIDSLEYDQLTQIEGVEYLFSFLWDDRTDGWYLDILDQSGNGLARGIRLNCGVDLLRRFRSNPQIPQGTLYVPNLSGADADMAVAGDLASGNFPLTYITSDDTGSNT